MRKIIFTEQAEGDLLDFQESKPKIYEKIKDLVQNIQDTPFVGLGKPEALKHQLRGFWSRRINIEHRLVYKVEDDKIIVVQCKGHY